LDAFIEFDPLKAKQTIDNEVAINAVKREIRNILDSYVGWYDPFCELIQNALDSIDERMAVDGDSFSPEIRVLVNLQENSVVVSDNGTGLSKEKYEQFLAPSFSFKSGHTRGHKGVGATYLAYGFNYIQIATKTDDFFAVGKMVNARKWLDDENPAGNPKVQPDKSGTADPSFDVIDKGVSVCLKFDEWTHPGNISWLKATNAEQWYAILSIKTGLGAFGRNSKIHVVIIVKDTEGTDTIFEKDGIEYLWPHTVVRKACRVRDIRSKEAELYKKKGKDFKLPSSMTKLDALYDTWRFQELSELITFDDAETLIGEKYSPTIYLCYMYSAKVWPNYNQGLAIRQGQQVLTSGIQIAANNMPQGEMYQIPLRRNIGRQNQVHCLIHFENCKADLGRKGFQKDIVDFCCSVARKLIEQPFQKLRYTLRPVTGVRDDLSREAAVDEWREEMKKHESDYPLRLINENFFVPMKRVSITSIPTREQDVIALFNQLIAGGVIRGIRIMSTNEKFTYDGMYRVVFEEPTDLHVYDRYKNPLGVLPEYVENHPTFTSEPKILEYKFSLDALIEDLDSGEKNSNDISLVVIWETGEDYVGNYHITSLLDEDNLSDRQYHGVTHVMTNLNSGQKEMDIIVLSELIEHLNDPDSSIITQKQKYED
jgi:hypothetical protein